MQKGMKVVVFCVCLIPFFYLFLQLLLNNLGPDPGDALSLETGEWTLRFLIATLAITPARQLAGIKSLNRYRRMIGLFVLFYAICHFLVFMMFILGFRWLALYQEILERPYITVGFSAFLILVALGVTSPKAMVRKLGKNWKRLHRLVYVAAVLGMVHMVWILRSDFGEALLYGIIISGLLVYRVVHHLRVRSSGFMAR